MDFALTPALPYTGKIIFMMLLFLVYLVDVYNLVKEICKIELIISENDVQARKLNELFGYLV